MPAGAVILTAYGIAMRWYSGATVSPVQFFVSNRYDRFMKGVVGCLTQPVLAAVSVDPDDSVGAAVAKNGARLLQANRWGHHDPLMVRTMVGAMERAGGRAELPERYVNIGASSGEDTSCGHERDCELSPGGPAFVVDSRGGRLGPEQNLKVWGTGDRIIVQLTHDMTQIPTSDAKRIVTGIVDVVDAMAVSPTCRLDMADSLFDGREV